MNEAPAASLLAVLLVLLACASAAAQTPTPVPDQGEEKWWEDLPAPAPPPPVATPSPTPGPLVGVLVRTTGGAAVSDAAFEAGVRDSGHRVFDGGAVRAYLAFQPPGRPLDDAHGQELRTQFRVDRMLVIEARGQASGAVAMRMRAFDPEGRVTSRFLEAPAAGVDAALLAAFLELPPVRERPKLPEASRSLGPVVSPPRMEVDTVDVQSIGITPIAIFQPQPPFPLEALAKRQAGVVKLQIIVDTTGKVSSVRALAGAAPFLEPAIAAVGRWRYQPVLVNGQPIIWKSTVSLKYQLSPSPTRLFPGMTKPLPSRFGDGGTREAGVFAGMSRGSTSTSLTQEPDASSQDRELAFHAFAAAFAQDGLELQGRLEIASEAAGARKSEVGLAFGIAWFRRPRQGWLFGPQIVGGLSSRAGEEKRPGNRLASFEGQGATGFAGLAARLPAGRVMFSAEAGAYYRVFDVQYSGAATASGRATESGVRGVVGVAWGSRGR